MSSNRLYKMFGKKSRLRREDISTYGQSNDERLKHEIEMNASDSFESDAMDGWEDLSYDTSVMHQLDKKFAPRSGKGLYIIGGITILSIVAILFIAPWNTPEEKTPIAENRPEKKEKITQLTEEQEITLDEDDLILPEVIQEMEPAPKKEQIKVTKIKKDFKEMKTNYPQEKHIEVKELPTIAIEPAPQPEEIVKNHIFASEIYLSELKLVDYRKYRSKPAVKTKQVVLSGTPANKEGEHSDEVDPNWKEVDIPYIDFIGKSARIFSKGSYKRALSRFETVLATYPTDVNANFYSGVCLYNLGEYEKAISSFNKCLSGPYSNFDEESQWMSALCYEKLGNNSKARSIFVTIKDQGGFYATQAAKKLK